MVYFRQPFGPLGVIDGAGKDIPLCDMGAAVTQDLRNGQQITAQVIIETGHSRSPKGMGRDLPHVGPLSELFSVIIYGIVTNRNSPTGLVKT